METSKQISDKLHEIAKRLNIRAERGRNVGAISWQAMMRRIAEGDYKVVPVERYDSADAWRKIERIIRWENGIEKAPGDYEYRYVRLTMNNGRYCIRAVEGTNEDGLKFTGVGYNMPQAVSSIYDDMWPGEP